MTAVEMLDSFIATLDSNIEGVESCLHDGNKVRELAVLIEQQINDELPSILETLRTEGLDELHRERLEVCLVKLSELHSKTATRVVWTQDFADYVRQSVVRID